MTRDTGLLACPFCGGEAERVDIEEPDDNFGGSYIHCKQCNASSQLQFDRKETLERIWNERIRPALPASADVQRDERMSKSVFEERIERFTSTVYMRQADKLETALRNMMAAYERRIRSECTTEQLAKEPWRCAEYVAAEQAIAAVQEPDTVP